MRVGWPPGWAGLDRLAPWAFPVAPPARQALVRSAPAAWPATDTPPGTRPPVIMVKAGLSLMAMLATALGFCMAVMGTRRRRGGSGRQGGSWRRQGRHRWPRQGFGHGPKPCGGLHRAGRREGRSRRPSVPLGDRRSAIADYGKALGIGPNHAAARCNRGIGNFALGRKNAARNGFRATPDLAGKSGQNDLAALAVWCLTLPLKQVQLLRE